MTGVTRRAVRTTAAIAGIAALGTAFADAAAALPDLPLNARQVRSMQRRPL